MVKIVTYRDPDRMAEALAALVAGQLADALALRGRASLAVPGGTTPGAFLSALSGAALDWANVKVLLTDERFVPETSPRSNTALLRRTLMQGAAKAATLVPMTADAASPEAALDALEAGLREALPLDVCVLGMGNDMHTASLFPGADRLDAALDPTGSHVLMPMRAANAPEPRLTLTAPVLSAAQHLHLLIKGQEKRATLERAMTVETFKEAPVRVALMHPAVMVHHAPNEDET